MTEQATHPSSLRRSRHVMVVAATALAAVLPMTSSPVSAVQGPLVVSSSSTTRVAPEATSDLDGLSITGNDEQTLQATLATDLGTLTIPAASRTGLTLAFDNEWDGTTSSITFTGSMNDINNGLASAQITTPAGDDTANVSLTASVDDPNLNYLSSNQRFYQYINSGTTTWGAADVAARNRTFRGQPGYLAAPVNAQINDFLANKIQNAQSIWIGLRAYDNSTVGNTTYPRVWRAAVGADQSPQQGTVVSICSNGDASECQFVNRSTYFDSWASGEPNNSGSIEDAAVTNWNNTVGQWNDLPAGSNSPTGYVVEYGGKTNVDDPSVGTGFTGVTTATSAIRVADASVAPDAPAISLVTVSDEAVELSWSPPANGGDTIESYEVSTDGGAWTTATTTETEENVDGNLVTTVSTMISGLTNGTAYDLRIRAVNSIGAGAASNTVTATPEAVPDAPTGVSGTPGDESVEVVFTAPGDDGGREITGYTATAAPGGASGTCVSSPCTITGLANGTGYTFTVVATNTVGDSTASGASDSVTPRTVPDAPTAVVATSGDESVSISFTAPVDNGGSAITGYTVSGSPGDVDVDCETSPCVVTGLTNGTEYSFTVLASNAAGDGAESSAVLSTPLTVPGAPTSVVATPGDTSISVSFTAPVDNGGSSITGYTVTGSPGDIDVDCETSPCVVSGLENGTEHTVTVVAINSQGAGPESTSASATPRTVSDAPTSVVVTADDESVSVSFSAPVDDGGDTVTGYVVTVQPGALEIKCEASPCEITELTNGTEYSFAVVAVNAAGNSAPTAAAVATPRTIPDAPMIDSLTPDDGSAAIAFTAPSNGGSVIIDYTVTIAPGGATATCVTSPCTVSGLMNGTEYTAQITARNIAGSSAASAPSSVTPRTTATPPTGVDAVQDGVGRAVVTFVEPIDDGGSVISGYSVIATPGGVVIDCAASPCIIEGLTTGSSVTFTVAANNAAGTSASSASSTALTLLPAPSTPTGVTVVSTPTTVTVTFDDSSDVTTTYTVTLQPGDITFTCAESPCEIDGLTPGAEYTVEVTATGPAGSSSASPSISIRTDRATGGFVPMSPSRALDSRLTERFEAREIREIDLSGVDGLPDDAMSVVVNVTVVGPSDDGFLSVIPCGETTASTSNINYEAGVTVAGSTIVDVADENVICVYTESRAHVIVDVNGATSPTAGSARLGAIEPNRAFDSRTEGVRVAADTVTRIPLPEAVPAAADAVVVNTTVVGAALPGYATVFGCDGDVPTSSNINFAAGQTIANSATTDIGADGDICVYSPVELDLVVDVMAHYSVDASTDLLRPVEAERLIDTRIEGAEVQTDEIMVVELPNVGGEVAVAAVVNLTSVDASAPGYLTAFPCEGQPPLSSNANYQQGVNVANSATVAADELGRICVYASSSTHLLVDLFATQY